MYDGKKGDVMKLRIYYFMLFACTGAVYAQKVDVNDVDIVKKSKDCQAIVQKAVEFFNNNSIDVVCESFSKDKKWRIGEIFPFIFDNDGVCYIHGAERFIIWHDFREDAGKSGQESMSFITEMLEAGRQGGVVSYEWDNGYKQSYVKTVEKDGKTFIVGAGFFPESAEYTAEQLVKKAARYFYAHGTEDFFGRVSDSFGIFVKGDIYLFVVDFDGNWLADGQTRALVGQNLYDMKSSDGKYIIREMIDLAKSKEGKGWYEYRDNHGDALKRAFVQRVTDPATKKNYVIVGGYYPLISDDSVRDFVKKAINYLQANGKDKAFSEFSNQNGQFINGSLNIFAYDLEGKSLADGQNPFLVGNNLMKYQDKEGHFVVRSILEQANKFGRGWLTILDKNAHKMLYIEKVSVPDGTFVVGSGYFPSSKPRTVQAIVDKGVDYLSTHSSEDALRMFTGLGGDFLRGELNITVHNEKGICLANGFNWDHIWRNDSKLLDTKGNSIIKKVVATAESGGGWVEYQQNNATRRTYVKQVTKKSKENRSESFILSCGYYL